MIAACDHEDASRWVGLCDCGAEVEACDRCLAEGRVKACGLCDTEEATNDRDRSLRWTRKLVQIKLGEYEEELDSWEGERLIAYVEAENQRLEAERQRLLAEHHGLLIKENRLRRELGLSEEPENGPPIPHLSLISDSAPAKVAASIQAETEAEAGRNDPCPCGSGRKYKKCCLKR